MKKSFSILLSVVSVILMAIPILPLIGGEGVEAADGAPSRYGFTPELYAVEDPDTEVICVSSGDFDDRNNDDLVIGLKDSIQVLKNNGASGSSFDFDVHQTISVSGFYITRIEFVDYDNDDDLDIVALGQGEYFMYGDPTPASTLGPSIFDMKIFYIENQMGTFSVEDSELFEDAYSFLSLWYYSECKFDMDCGDLDGDGDIDTVVAYTADNDGNTANGGERIFYKMIEYESENLTNSTIQQVNMNLIAEMNPLVGIADFDNDTKMDVVYSYGGIAEGGAMIEARLFIKWHTGVGASWGTPVDLDPNDNLIQGGIMGSIPYALAIGEFAGSRDYPDIALTNNRNGGTSPPFGDAGIYLVRTKSGRTFGDPFSAYSQVGDFMIRGMAVGNMKNDTRDDVVCFQKIDTTSDPSPYDSIDNYGLTLVGARQSVPYRFIELKKFQTPTTLPFQMIKDVAVGNFDNDPNGFDDIVYVGDKVTVGLTTYPPNNPPSKVRVTVSPTPILNDDRIATVNLTLEDLDGWSDMTKIEVDFTPIGLSLKVVNEPVKDPDNTTIGFYEFDIKVPPTVKEGDYDIKFYMYDKSNSPIGRNQPKSNDTFLFRVKQYNREPEIALDPGNQTLYVKEDTPTYFENVYDWFVDLDIEEGYTDIPLNISLRSYQSDSFVTSAELKNMDGGRIFKVELKNGSGGDPWNWSLLITPGENFHHPEGLSDQLTMRAFDGELKTDPLLRMKVVILPVNDEPIIPVQKRYPSDAPFEFTLEQGEVSGSYPLNAVDEADEQTPYLEYFFEYDDPADEDWLYISRDGTVSWFPENEHVGPHKVTLWVYDGEANISQVMWFNVTNVIDSPYFVYVSNGTKTFTDIPRHISERYEFIIKEHEEFNLTIKVEDPDRLIGLQDDVSFKCNLTVLNNTYLHVDPDDPFKAYFHFVAERKYGYYATYEPDSPPIETEIIVTDGMDQDVLIVFPIRVIIENVNDPPIFVEIDKPEEGASFPILYNIEFSAGEALDPDTVYNDTLTFQWDFDASDGFQSEFVGLNGRWNFPSAGSYMITLRVVDSAGNYIQAQKNITVSGVRDDDDFDNDGMTNKWEDEYGLDKYDPTDAEEDSDGDGLTNAEEYLNLTDPRRRDSDGDGSPDGEDYSPLDSLVWKEPKEEEDWTDDTTNIIVIIVIILVVLLILIALFVFLLMRSRKKAKEEEEKRKQAEQMQKTMYEDQDLYSDLPSADQTQPAAAVEAAPTAPQLPPQAEEGLDDIFGGAGTLPSQQQGEGLPPGPQEQQQPQAQLPPRQEEEQKTGDVTDLLDQ